MLHTDKHLRHDPVYLKWFSLKIKCWNPVIMFADTESKLWTLIWGKYMGLLCPSYTEATNLCFQNSWSRKGTDEPGRCRPADCQPMACLCSLQQNFLSGLRASYSERQACAGGESCNINNLLASVSSSTGHFNIEGELDNHPQKINK